MLAFIKNLAGVKFDKISDSAVQALVRWDPKSASEAELRTMEQHLDTLGREVALARHFMGVARCPQACQAGTAPTIFQTKPSRSPSFFGRRVLTKAAQQKPPCVRTMMVLVPGRLPPCHQLSYLLTDQPLA